MTAIVYLAGPGVFRPDAHDLAQAQKALCRRHGFEPLHPADPPASQFAGRPAPESARIYRANLAMIRRADALLADLDPFRGPEADPGTAFEIGFAAALGKPVVGYVAAPDCVRQRVARLHGPIAHCPDTGAWRDRDGNLIEDFGHPANLMLAEACAAIVAGGLEAALLWLRERDAALRAGLGTRAGESLRGFAIER